MNFSNVLQKLECGEMRAAEKINGSWVANTDVKAAILAAFREGQLKDYATHNFPGFIDKDTLPPQNFALSSGVRMVPGGSSVRAGAYIGKNTIIMPPSFINVGAFIDCGTMVDSHVLVGSCAQIGKNVHLSAGVQIGGVLEPVGLAPVVVEDDAFIGAGVILVEGIHILRGAVVAPGVKLSRSIPIFDCVHERMLAKNEPIPEYAVVVPGSRPVATHFAWATTQGLHLSCALIIKYRDDKTSAALTLESALRT